MRLGVFVAGDGRNLAVAIVGIHGCADRKAGQQPTARNHIQHGELLGHPDRRVVQGNRVADHRQGRLGGPSGQAGGNDVGRGHQAIAVLVVLIHADTVKAQRVGVFELVHVLVVDKMALFGVVEAIG